MTQAREAKPTVMTKLFQHFTFTAVSLALFGNITPVTATTLYGFLQGKFQPNDHGFSAFNASFSIDSTARNRIISNTQGLYSTNDNYEVSLFDSGGNELATLDTANVGRVIVTNSPGFDRFSIEFFDVVPTSLPIAQLSLNFLLPPSFFESVALPTTPLILNGGTSFAIGSASNFTSIVGDANLTLGNGVTPVPESNNVLGLGILGLGLLLWRKVLNRR